jgi:hypothetical protein
VAAVAGGEEGYLGAIGGIGLLAALRAHAIAIVHHTLPHILSLF